MSTESVQHGKFVNSVFDFHTMQDTTQNPMQNRTEGFLDQRKVSVISSGSTASVTDTLTWLCSLPLTAVASLWKAYAAAFEEKVYDEFGPVAKNYDHVEIDEKTSFREELIKFRVSVTRFRLSQL